MDLPAPYDEDLHAWALHQAQVIRRLKASGLPLPNDLDLEHVAEEIEDLGNEQRFQVEGNLTQALAHILKLALRPDDQAVPHWRGETAAFLGNARRRYRPSMRRAIDVQALWADARALVRQALDATEPAGLPEAMPFTIEELLDRDALPTSFATRLAAAIAAA